MTESVKPRRRYESPRRAAQAAQTRRDIVTAAGRLFRTWLRCAAGRHRERGRRRGRDHLPDLRDQGGGSSRQPSRRCSRVVPAGPRSQSASGRRSGRSARSQTRANRWRAMRRRSPASTAVRVPSRAPCATPGAIPNCSGCGTRWRPGGSKDRGASCACSPSAERHAATSRSMPRSTRWTLCSLAVYDLLVLDGAGRTSGIDPGSPTPLSANSSAEALPNPD